MSRVLDWMGQTGPGFGAKVLEKLIYVYTYI